MPKAIFYLHEGDYTASTCYVLLLLGQGCAIRLRMLRVARERERERDRERARSHFGSSHPPRLPSGGVQSGPALSGGETSLPFCGGWTCLGLGVA